MLSSQMIASDDADLSSVDLRIPRHSIYSSDETTELFCDTCAADEKIVTARGYCADCEEYLCTECVDFHRRQKLLKTHVIIEGEQMPSKKARDVKDKCVDKCAFHCDKVIEFICKSCDTLGCYVCMVTHHKKCDDTCFIKDLSIDETFIKQYSHIKEDFESFIADITRQKSNTKVNVRKNKRLYETAKKVLKLQRDEAFEVVTQLFQTQESSLDSFYENNVQRLNVCATELDSLIQSGTNVLTELNSREAANQHCQKFVAMKNAERNIRQYRGQLVNTEARIIVHRYLYLPNEHFSDSLQDVGKVTERTEMFRNLKLVKEINVQSSAGSCIGRPAGLSVLNENLLVYAEANTDRIQLIDVNRGVLMSTDESESIVGDVTRLEQDKFAVTYPNDKKIVFYLVFESTRFSEMKTVHVNGKCHGIDSAEGKLFVTYIRQDKRVEILDMEGNVLKCFRSDSGGSRLFACPRYITFNPELRVMYISDSATKTVTSITEDGEVVARYLNERGEKPYGLCTDSLGKVYVCSFKPLSDPGYAESIFVLSEYLGKEYILESEHFNGSPKCIAYDEKKKRIYVALKITTSYNPVIRSFDFY